MSFQLLNSNKDCDNLRVENKMVDDNHIRKTIELENMKQQTSEITLNYEHDLTVLNKSLNDMQSTQSMRLREREKQFQDRCHDNELDKNNIINDFNDIKFQKENIIKDLNKDLENNRFEFKNVIDNLTSQNISLENELTNVIFDNNNIKSDINKTKASLEGEIIFLQNVNTNIINELKIKEDELVCQIEIVSKNISDTDNNGEKLLKNKNSTIFELECVNDNLEKDCDVQTKQNKDITFSKNSLAEDLEKCRQDHHVFKDELSIQINLINHNIKDRTSNFSNQIHDSECQRLSRDETLRTLEDNLRNMHEDRVCKEKEQLNVIAELNINIDEKNKEQDTYQLDSENQKALLQNNNDVKDLKIKDLETNLINLDKRQCQTRLGLEKDIMNVNSDILACDKELDSGQSKIKTQNQSLSEVNERNNKLTSELVMNQDSYNRDKQYQDIEIDKINKDLQDLNYSLSDTKQNVIKATNDRNELSMQKEMETNKQRQEHERICDELHFEKAKRFEIDQLDRFNYNRIKEMEKANEQWRKKYGALEKEKKDAMYVASNSRIELAEVKDIIKRQKY